MHVVRFYKFSFKNNILGASLLTHMVKNLPTSCIPESGRSLDKEMATHSRYSGLEEYMDRGALEGFSPWGGQIIYS